MTVFLCDGECEYSYDDLLRHLNQDNYFPLLKTHHLFSYFGNLVKALTNDVPLVLLDSDLSPAELDGVDESLVNQSIPLSVKRLPSMGEVIEALVHSTSEITMFTSGTTGQPKKVVHSIQTLTRSVRREKSTTIKFGRMLTILRIWQVCKCFSRHLKISIH